MTVKESGKIDGSGTIATATSLLLVQLTTRLQLSLSWAKAGICTRAIKTLLQAKRTLLCLEERQTLPESSLDLQTN